ncbi:MAG TPA: outer membrane beta-barrel protein [Gemmatimonadaceae bacterium]|nr:outer membrane beta-barrel protein [Gemmatimonadaceae bacterium]
MKRLVQLGLALLFTGALALPAMAQSLFRVGVSGGGTAPVRRFGELNAAGYNFGAHVLISSPFFPQDFKIDVSHNRMKLDGSDANTMVTSATLNLELNPGSALARIAPYVSAGLGGYYVKTALSGPAPTFTQYENTTKFGLNAGAGLRFPLSALNAFLEARYHRVKSDRFVSGSVTYVPIVFGLTF